MVMHATELSAAERKDVMASMSDNFENQEDPKVGIFWYDETDDELFGVTAAYAQELPFNSNGLKTVRTLHKTWWQEQKNKAVSKGKNPGIFIKDYTLIPRGRIFQSENGVFQLMCGSWINEHIVGLVRDEFNLKNVPLEVKVDIHWEIGQGWSEYL